MTYIKLDEEMKLTVTRKDPIYRGDNMNKAIIFLLPLTIGTVDMKSATVFLTYVRPDASVDVVVLVRAADMYDQNHYKYVLPVTCKLSRFPGDICMWLQLYSGNSGDPTVAKSSECVISILDSQNIDNCMSDHQLTVLYQIKQRVDNMIENDASSSGSCGDSSGDSSNIGGFDAVEF